MFESLSERLTQVFSNLSRKKNLTEENITDALNNIKTALLASDVSFQIVQDLIAEVKHACIGQRVLQNIQPGQQVIKIVYDKLVTVLGGELAALSDQRPLNILLVGLHGAGKTTSCAKLAQYLKSTGEQPGLVACDIYRPAAIEQLKILGQQINVPVFSYDYCDVPTIGKKALKEAAEAGYSVLIFDTAGRLQIDLPLIEEVKQLKALIRPEEILLVADSALGQEAVNVAKTFHDALRLTGLILTKLDGDAKGGAALSMKRAVDIPIKFAGIGEKLGDFEKFYPDRMASRILGMGDIVSLVEKAQSEIGDEAFDQMANRALEGDFTIEDFLTQLQQMKKLGSAGLAKWLPGISTFKVSDQQEHEWKHVEAIILSMTVQERKNPCLLNSTYRRLRISKGAGLPISEFNRFLKRYQTMKKMFQKIRKTDPSQLQGMLQSFHNGQFLNVKKD
ncbi:MAG: signal recognition particle protein [Puniceicoccales bacterium]|jgi:signal recognition particle subunit SRP54|nr:signal recognition particle protein [Puniceicoccales bacterium]